MSIYSKVISLIIKWSGISPILLVSDWPRILPQGEYIENGIYGVFGVCILKLDLCDKNNLQIN